LGAWVLGVRPHDRVNRVLAAYFLLLAGGALAFVALRNAPTSAQALFTTRVYTWYSIPLVLAVPLVLDAVFGPRPRTRAWSLGLAVAGGGTFALLVLQAVAPTLFQASTRFSNGPMGAVVYVALAEPLAVAYGGLVVLLQALGIALAARAASDKTRASLPRRQAAMVGLASGLLAVHGGFAYGLVPLLIAGLSGLPLRAVYILGLVVVAAVLPRLLAPFDRRARFAAMAIFALALLTGVLDSGLRELPALSDVLPPARNTRPLLVAASAVALALAVLRYGLAGVAEESRRRFGSAGAVAAALVLGLGLSAASLVSLGATLSGAAAASLGFVVPFALVAGPLRGVAPRVASRVLLQADALDVGRERVRVYTAALRAGVQNGEAPRADDPVLAALRRELGLTEADHATLSAEVAAQPAGAAAPQVFLGRYFVLRELARGGTSTAYLARDSVLGRAVVLKRLAGLGDLAPAFAAEVHALRQVQHPRVLRLHEAVQAGHEVFLLLEYAPGGSLEERLAREGPLPPAEAVRLTGEVLEGLAAVHEAGLVHGDLKPANVLLTSQGHAKVADFGAARGADRTAALAHTAPLGPAMGTLAAMAPEQVLGEAATSRSDVYAAGALLFRLLTGEDYVDLRGLHEREARGRVLHEPPRLPHPRVPSRVEVVLRRALAKEQDARWASAEEIRRALAGAAAEL
jgi:MFS family permease